MDIRKCTDLGEINILFKHMMNSDTSSTIRYRDWGVEGERHIFLFKNKQQLNIVIKSPTEGCFEFHTETVRFIGEIPANIIKNILKKWVAKSEDLKMSDFITGLHEGNREHPIKKPVEPPNVTFTDTPVRGSEYD